MVTRGKARAGRVKTATMRVRSSAGEDGGASLKVAPRFVAALTAARKRKAKDSVNNKLTAVAETIAQLVAAQKQTAESQRVFHDSNKAILSRMKALLESNQAMTVTIKAQGEEIKALKALLQGSRKPGTYSEVTANSGAHMSSQTSRTRFASAGGSQVCKEVTGPRRASSVCRPGQVQRRKE